MRRTLLTALSLIAVLPAAAGAEPSLSERGQKLLEEKCSSCHATGRSGSSPLAGAPEFRGLKARYPLENLSEALAEGIVTGHPVMPHFVFQPFEIAAILAYLDDIGTK